RIVHLARAEHRIIGYGLAVRRRFLPIPETVVRRFDTAVGSVDADLESLPRTGERDRIRHARASAIPDDGRIGGLDVDLLVVQVDRVVRCVLHRVREPARGEMVIGRLIARAEPALEIRAAFFLLGDRISHAIALRWAMRTLRAVVVTAAESEYLLG